MSAHTPGPWKFDSNLGCKAIKGGKRGATKQAQYTEIAYTVGLNNDYEDEANARLISAAPDMYEALKAVIADYGIRCSPDDALRPIGAQPMSLRLVMAALAKAGGQ